MSYASWPASLPTPNVNGFDETSTLNWVEDENDIGGPQRRLTETKSRKLFSFSIILSSTEKTVLETFYSDTITQIQYFYWTHPETSTIYLVFMQNAPAYNAIAPDLFETQVELFEV